LTDRWDGLLLVDKPPGPTSHDIVAAVRRVIGGARVGHAGTLDPAASGLLPLVLGQATRLVRFLPVAPKVYTGELRLGVSTDTDDIGGRQLAHHEGELPPAEAVLGAARGLLGPQLQQPPTVSARWVSGQRMYRLARKGVAVQARPASVHVFRFEMAPSADPAVWRFEAEVSAGTYIRALARDLGAALGCGGTLVQLRRTRIGPFEVESGMRLAPDVDANAGALLAARIPLDSMPLDPPELLLANAERQQDFVHGRICPAPAACADPGIYRVTTPGGMLIGVGQVVDGDLRPRVVLARSSGP